MITFINNNIWTIFGCGNGGWKEEKDKIPL